MIGLDAAELTLVRRWMDEGALPNLRRLRQRGAFGELHSPAEWLVGSPWPTFYTGSPPQEHGMYHYLIWRPETMSTERPNPDWLPLHPFWRRLDGTGKRAVVLDVPNCYAPEPFDGIEISGWATHEAMMPAASHPSDRLAWANSKFGIPPIGHEEARPLSVRESLQVRAAWLRVTRLVGDLSLGLMEEEPWDLFLVCFTAPHRGGHQFWDETSLVREATEDERQQHRGALRELYVACDTEIGRIVERAGDATVLVFALHGMGVNQSRADILPEMLRRVLADADSDASPPTKQAGPVDRLRSMVPVRWRSRIKKSLPIAIQDRLTVYWRSHGIDWRTTRAFPVFTDFNGYIRVNLRGREALGIVEPGEEYQSLLRRIADGLRTFVDEDTGEPVVNMVGLREELFPGGCRGKHLPDLIAQWSLTSAARHRRIVSPRFGALDWPTPGHHPEGRSGNHRSNGFLFAAGDRIPAGGTIEGAGVLDLVPTVYALLGLRPPPEMQGRPLFATKELGQ
jgi:predicted AlkP superfamily phosphohydrolase/phosphomutase